MKGKGVDLKVNEKNFLKVLRCGVCWFAPFASLASFGPESR